ncbi:SCC2 [Auxenochlorella protothecoides x Auxenochlorella symbiontica]
MSGPAVYRCRLETTLLPDPPFHRFLPTPFPPSDDYKSCCTEDAGSSKVSDEFVKELAGLIAATDVSFLNPRCDETPGASAAMTPLQAQLLEISPTLFDATSTLASRPGTRASARRKTGEKTTPGAHAGAAANRSQVMTPSPQLTMPQAVAPQQRRTVLPFTMTCIKKEMAPSQDELCRQASDALASAVAEYLRQEPVHAASGETDWPARSQALDRLLTALVQCSSSPAMLHAVAGKLLPGPVLPPDVASALTQSLLVAAGGAEPSRPTPDGDGSPEEQAYKVNILGTRCLLILALHPFLSGEGASDVEVLQRICRSLRSVTCHSVLPFLDPAWASLFRPDLLGTSPDEEGKARGGLAQAARGPDFQTVCHHAQAALASLADLVSGPGQPLPTHALGPVVTCAAQVLGSAGSAGSAAALCARAADLVGAVLGACPELRQEVVADVLRHALLPLGGGTTRATIAGLRDPAPGMTPGVPPHPSVELPCRAATHAATALLAGMHRCVALPAPGACSAPGLDCSAPALSCADGVWRGLLERCTAQRAQRGDAEHDARAALEALVAELVGLAWAPEWPAAQCMLGRLVPALVCASRTGDAGMEQFCLAVAGKLVGPLGLLSVTPTRDVAWAGGDAAAEGGEAPDPAGAATAALTRHLVTCGLPHAARFAAVLHYAEGVQQLRQASTLTPGDAPQAVPAEAAEALLLQAHCLLEAAPFGTTKLTDAEAGRASRAASLGRTKRARHVLLRWILDTLDGAAAAPATRARALKALGEAVRLEPGLLGTPTVRAAVEAALTDEAVSVREAGLNLLLPHARQSEDLALEYYDALVRASKDVGVSVRKVGIRALADCFLLPDPASPRAMETARHILLRAGDAEASVRDVVARTFHALWFADGAPAPAGTGLPPGEQPPDSLQGAPPLDAGRAQAGASLGVRASLLATLAASMRRGAGRAFHLPLELGHPLVVVLRAALEHGGPGRDAQARHSAGCAMAGALLGQVIAAHEGEEPAAHTGALGPLLALHALARVSPDLCLPPDRPGSMLASLAPYLRGAGSAGAGDRLHADYLLALLALVHSLVEALGPATLLAQGAGLVETLASLVNKHPFVQVVGAACRTLCALSRSAPPAAAAVAQLAGVYATWLQDPDREGPQRPHLSRFLFILGQLCRHGGGAVLDEGRRAVTAGVTLSVPAVQGIILRHYHRAEATPTEQESALQALGGLVLARPGIMLGTGAPPNVAMKQALADNAAAALKLRALSNLADLLHPEGATGTAGERPGAVAVGSVPTCNGTGDALSHVGSIVQDHWDLVLARALESGAEEAEAVRARALDVMEAVLREGLVGPWTAVQALGTLACDPGAENAARAVALLGSLVARHAAYVGAERLVQGIQAAPAFLATVDAGHGVRLLERSGVFASLAELYDLAIRPHPKLCTDFFKVAVRRFRTAASVPCVPPPAAAAPPASTGHTSELPFLALTLAHLRLRRGDEACALLAEVSGVLSARGEEAAWELREALARGSQAPGGPTPSTAPLLALALLLRLKNYLQGAYAISDDRIAAYASSGERRRQEERIQVSPSCAPDARALAPEHFGDMASGQAQDPAAALQAFEEALGEDGAPVIQASTPAEHGTGQKTAGGVGKRRRTGMGGVGKGKENHTPSPEDSTEDVDAEPMSTRGKSRGARGASITPQTTVLRTSSRIKRSLARVAAAQASDPESEGEDGDATDGDDDWSPGADQTRKKLRL